MPQIMFIGSLGTQSVDTLKGLLASGQQVSVIAIAASTVGLKAAVSLRQRYIPVIGEDSSDTILSISVKEGIPLEILEAYDSGEQLRPYAPDVGIVSCFPHRLSESFLKVPRFGCYNLHPSLLPKYRGPAPLFWQLRNGETRTGVTLHKMSQAIDTGDIVAQKQILIGDGTSENTLSRHCATRGVELITLLLKNLQSGSLTLTPQDEQQASYHGWPGEQDFQISTDWPARRIYNFVRGTLHRERAYTLHIGTDCFSIGSVDEIFKNPIQGKEYILDGNRIQFNCYDGSIKARLTD